MKSQTPKVQTPNKGGGMPRFKTGAFGGFFYPGIFLEFGRLAFGIFQE
jgi:hypothetical protein